MHRDPALRRNTATTASPYFRHAEDLDQSVDSIRLLRIHPDISPHGQTRCSIRRMTIRETTYNCFSYEGGSDVGGGLISIGGSAYHVCQNLLDFLEVTRKKRHKSSLWIDALYSIDQHNLTEKNHQVKLMGKIYAGS
jgi:hypothetical protein